MRAGEARRVVGHHAGNAVFAVSAAIDALVVLPALIWAARGKSGARRLAAAGLVVVTLLAAKGALLVAVGVEARFGLLHVLWLDLVIVAPLGGAAALLLTRRSPSRGIRLLATLAVLLAPVGLYASFVEPDRLVVERAELDLPRSREGRQPVRVGVIADLQFEHLGDHERAAVRRLLDGEPDVILLAGDYHQGSTASHRRELPRLRALLRKLHAPGGVYAVQGDVEGRAEARRVVAGTGVRLLFNEIQRVGVRGRELTVGGVELRYRSRAARAISNALETEEGDGDIRILLAHRPDVAFQLASPSRVDIVVAGHTHGGQLQLPLVGPLHIASRVPREVGAGGLHDLDGRRIYVSRGVGVERAQAPKLRLGAPPEVSLITLR